jgi:predicted transcriptional regulator
MKTLRVGVMSYEAMKQRTKAIARGELKPRSSDPKVWFTSIESLARVLSERNRALLEIIAEEKPSSVKELAALSGRAAPNLLRTLRTFERYGLVAMKRGARGSVRPEALAGRVEFSIALQSQG